MDNLQLVLEESKASYDAGRYSSEYIFGHTCTLELIQTPGVHELHTIVDTRLYEEGAVKFDDFWSDRSMENVQFHYDGVQLGLIELEADFLMVTSFRV